MIFKEKVRRDNKFWGMLGYVKHLKTTSAQKQKMKKGDTMRMYHRQLSVILDSLIKSNDKIQTVSISFDKKSLTLQYCLSCIVYHC